MQLLKAAGLPNSGRPSDSLSQSVQPPLSSLVSFRGAVVMEPFVKMGGGVGNDIKVWRDLSDNADEAQMDAAARQSLAFSRYVLG